MKKKIFTLLTLLVAVCSGTWADVNTTLISGITLPSVPTGVYTGGTTVSHNGTNNAVVVDANGVAVMQAVAPGYGSPTADNFTWTNACEEKKGDGSWSTTGTTWDASGVFVGSSAYTTSGNAHYVNFARRGNLRNVRTFAYRFTNCWGFSALVKSNGDTEAGAAVIAVYEGDAQVGTAQSYTKALDVITVKNLDVTKTYTAYVYGANGSNGELYEVAFLPTPVAPSFTTDLSSTEEVTVNAASTFTVVASSATTYTWYKGSSTTADPENDTQLQTGSSASYEYTATSAGTEYIYCVATGDGGSTTSTVCAVTATAASVAPTITTDLSSSALTDIMSTLSLSIVATDAASYQWYTCDDAEKTNPVAIDGATETSYDYSPEAVGTVYIYCVATNPIGSATSTVCAVKSYGFTTIYSMSAPTAPTEKLDAGSGSDLTATFVGGSGYVYNGHASNASQMVTNGNVNLAGSGNSYFKTILDKAVQEGDVITVYSAEGTKDETAEAYYVSTSNTKGSIKYTFPYKVTSTSALKGAEELYFWKSSSNSIYSVTVSRKVEQVTISSSGLSTLASAYALDFSGVEGLEAYVVEQTDPLDPYNLLCTQITEAPAATGLIISGTAGAEYTIPVAESASLEVNNILEAAVEATELEAGDAILKDGAFHAINNASTLAAGKAYVPSQYVPDVSSSARALTLVFGKVTGVNAVEAAAEAQAADGKYLENGKIVIVKNGKKFNAAGAQVK